MTHGEQKMKRSPLLRAALYVTVTVLSLVALLSLTPGVESQQVAIVGAGIGGASTSYYLHKWRPQSSITVFERNDYIGGRLKHIVLDGVTVEVGGDAWSQVNAYMVELAQELNIQFDNTSYSGNGRVEVWDGQRWYATSSNWIGEAELLGLMEWLRANLWLNYLERGSGNAFRSIGEFTRYGGLEQWALLSCNELVKKYGIDQDLVWRNWIPISRVIYDQDLKINSFAGMVVLLSAFTTSYTVEGGNSLLVEKLLAKSGADVHLNTQVTRIARVGNGYSVTTVPASDGGASASPKEQEQLFDSVVLAAPIEFSSLQFVNITLPPITPRTYSHWFVTHVAAKTINPTYFNLPPSSEAPSYVLTSDNSTAPFNSIQTEALGADGNVIFKIFGNVNLTSSTLERMFVKLATYHVQHWPYTFPDLSPVKDSSQYQPVVLDESGSLLYLSSMESVATAMEASVIAGRNAALLLAQQNNEHAT